LKHVLRSFPLASLLVLGVPFVVTTLGCSGDTKGSSTDGGPHDGAAVDAIDDQPPLRDSTMPGDSTPPQDAPADTADVINPCADPAPTLPADAAPPMGAFCSLPGSVVWAGACPSPYVVPGGPAGSPDLKWLKLPAGFCAHYFGNVPDARQIRFAPGGELFASSPTGATTGGNYGAGLESILVLPDDNHDGVADQNITFLSHLPNTQGLLFANSAFYYQDNADILSVPYTSGERTLPANVTPQKVTTITAPQDGLHWTKVLDIAMDGTIYITNGGSQGDSCLVGDPVRGAVFKLNSDGSTTLVAKGFRNPIAIRCSPSHDVCVATELALDYSDQHGGREKVVPIRSGDDWGYPCCATQDLPYTGAMYIDGGTPDCTGIAADTDSFVIGHTPFGIDFETGKWPAPWAGRAFVTLHGVAGTWTGARVVSLAVDPTSGAPLPGTELDTDAGQNTLLEFATGWDDGSRAHGRPAPITFATDGRMFLGDDNLGNIVWIAPIDLSP
jgi:glucose/arabinose dehydrogenase